MNLSMTSQWLSHALIACWLNYCELNNTETFTILNDSPFSNVNIRKRQQCQNVHREMNLVGTLWNLLRSPLGFRGFNHVIIQVISRWTFLHCCLILKSSNQTFKWHNQLLKEIWLLKANCLKVGMSTSTLEFDYRSVNRSSTINFLVDYS